MLCSCLFQERELRKEEEKNPGFVGSCEGVSKFNRGSHLKREKSCQKP